MSNTVVSLWMTGLHFTDLVPLCDHVITTGWHWLHLRCE